MDLLVCPQLMLLFVTMALSTILGAGNNVTDRLSLLSFKAEITDDPLGILSSWNESTHFCQWPGISCSRRHVRVTVVDLEGFQLKGQLSSHIGNLSFLRKINLQNNSFEGKIPEEISRLFRLQTLELEYNFFNGELPVNLSHCSNLRNLSLYDNNLTGQIPKDIGSLSKLEILELGKNNFGGEIPTSIGNLSSLVWLYLNDNKLQGGIPSSFGKLKRLNDLVVGGNNLSGSIPPSIYNLTSITQFCVEMNRLHGRLPANLGRALPELEFFLFHTNQFSGQIPASISNASGLLEFDVSANDFSGNMPSLEGLPYLERISIHENMLGHNKDDDLYFLYSLINCTHLGYLSVSQNNFGGVVPEIMSNFSESVHIIDLGTNRIRGSIPAGISKLINLEALGFYENQMTGPIPSSIGRLHKLHIFDAFDNNFSGSIPYSVGNLSSLHEFFIMLNNLQGSIPVSLGQCKQLKLLVLSQNSFSGPIPKQVMSLSSLTHLELFSNNLNGSIPIEVEKLGNLVYLDISNNKLSGQIPEALGRCTSLIHLYLQGNSLHGSIPKSLQSLRGIEEIDLSSNNLSGPVPSYLGSFRHLQILNLSWNDFEGEVPVQGIFRNASAISIIGNERLCGGMPQLELPICASNEEKKQKLSYVQKLIISIASGLVAFILILLSARLYWLRKKSKSSGPGSSFGISFLRVSYRELLEATDRFSSANLIGMGSFGSVYKGLLLKEGKNVAVKVLNLQTSKASKSFVVECKALKRLRHRNLVKLLTVCSSTDFQGNDFKALVYELVAGGSLEEWIHPGQDHVDLEEGQKYLNLIQRVSISIDVANALDYLHNNSHMPTVHCDLKPTNILLESDMTARVGDFGLARLLPNYSHVRSSDLISSSMGMRGSIGYVAPEYGMGSEVTAFGDVYSYGILLLEMFTGKRPTDAMFRDDLNIREFASAALPERVEEIVDPRLLQREYNSRANNRSTQAAKQRIRECLTSIIGIGLACSAERPQQRMNISNVVCELCRTRDLLVRTRMR